MEEPLIKKLYVGNYKMIGGKGLNMLGTVAQNDKGEMFVSLRMRNEHTGDKKYFFDGEVPRSENQAKLLMATFEALMNSFAKRPTTDYVLNRRPEFQTLIHSIGLNVESVINEHIIDIKADNTADMIKEINATGLFNIGTATPMKDGKSDPKQVKKFLKRSRNHEITDEENSYNAFLASQKIQWGEMKEKEGIEKTALMLTNTIKDCKNKPHKKALKLVLKGLVEITN